MLYKDSTLSYGIKISAKSLLEQLNEDNIEFIQCVLMGGVLEYRSSPCNYEIGMCVAGFTDDELKSLLESLADNYILFPIKEIFHQRIVAIDTSRKSSGTCYLSDKDFPVFEYFPINNYSKVIMLSLIIN